MENVKLSYSHQGQDLILIDLFRNYPKGIYVDIGCNDPIKYSNTYILYKLGWNGLAIDAEGSFQKKWSKYRNKDLFINIAISKDGQKISFYKFGDDTTSTADEATMKRYRKKFGDPLEIVTMESSIAEQVLLDNDISVDFELLCVDAEGKDLDVLESLNLNRYRPKIILVEIKLFNFLKPRQASIVDFLYSHDYIMIAKTLLDGIFIDRSQDLGWIPEKMINR